MKKILIVGCYGMMGYNIFTILNNNDKYKVFGSCRQGKKHTTHNNIYEVNHLENFDINNFIDFIKPDVIINCIAQLRETNINEKINMVHANCLIPLYLAEICDKNNIYFIHFSTDAVFGSNNLSDKKDNYLPDSFYGLTKCISEFINKNGIILRICPIGYEKFSNKSLFNFIYNNDKNTINGYKNCFFNGATTLTIIKYIIDLIDNKKLTGIYHITSDQISKFDLLNLINDTFKLNKTIIPIEEPKISRILKEDLKTYYSSWESQIKELYSNMHLFN